MQQLHNYCLIRISGAKSSKVFRKINEAENCRAIISNNSIIKYYYTAAWYPSQSQTSLLIKQKDVALSDQMGDIF